MNPEFRRNLWLELTARRMAVMAGALALLFFAATLPGGIWTGPGDAARVLFYLIVVIWGSRNAALAVVGEIRMRTWDGQRLSALSAGQMLWGKLFGATVYQWFGGALCLLVIQFDSYASGGIGAALSDLIYFPVIGVIAQSAALLASLIAVVRMKNHSRMDVFFYQLAGLCAALLAFWLWSAGDPAHLFADGAMRDVRFGWWGMAFDARIFLLASLAAFAGWLLVGCLRMMRIELMQRNGPFVWLGFLLFVGLYVGGFDGVDFHDFRYHIVAATSRLALAGLVFAGLAYVMVFLEPKDKVLYRWTAGAFANARLGEGVAALQGWVLAWLCAGLCAVTLIALIHEGAQQAWFAALIGIMTRDLAVVVLCGVLTRRHGDLAALVALIALHLLLPMIVEGVQCTACLVLFRPEPVGPVWLTPAIVWAEAVLAVSLAAASIALRETAED